VGQLVQGTPLPLSQLSDLQQAEAIQQVHTGPLQQKPALCLCVCAHAGLIAVDWVGGWRSRHCHADYGRNLRKPCCSVYVTSAAAAAAVVAVACADVQGL
jgi:hypothetical protein